MKSITYCGRPATILFALLFTISGVLSAQEFRVEGEIGVNLFSFSDPVFTSDVESDMLGKGEVEADLTHDISLGFGAYGGVNFDGFEVGLELSYVGSGGDTSNLEVDGDSIPDSSGNYDFSYYKIGPVFRYYIPLENPLFEPFAGTAVDYVGATIDIDDPSIKVSQDYINIGVFGGAAYWVQEQLYVGGMARFDYYRTIQDDSITGIEVDTDVEADFKNIKTDGWMPFTIYFVVGTVF